MQSGTYYIRIHDYNIPYPTENSDYTLSISTTPIPFNLTNDSTLDLSDLKDSAKMSLIADYNGNGFVEDGETLLSTSGKAGDTPYLQEYLPAATYYIHIQNVIDFLTSNTTYNLGFSIS